MILPLVADTAKLQTATAVRWRDEIIPMYEFREDRPLTIPRDIELAFRNPAVYFDRIESGEIAVDAGTHNRWQRIIQGAGRICDAQYLTSGTDIKWIDKNRLSELQHLAYTNRLSIMLGNHVTKYLVSASEVFSSSLEEEFGSNSLLVYFNSNATEASRQSKYMSIGSSITS